MRRVCFGNRLQNTAFSAGENNSYLDKLDNLKPAEALEYLTSVTSDKNQSKKFIEEITSNPRNSRSYVKKIYNILGAENFDYWYFGKNGYMQAFHNYIENFYDNAQSVEELVHYMPSWGDWKLAEKSEQLCGERHYTVGKLPSGFGDKETFRHLADIIKNSYWSENRAKGNININGKCFKVDYPQNGLSGKIVAIINDDYILKTSFDRKYKADSPYLNMTVDYYLDSNHCNNSAKFLYYDDLTDSVLYKKSEIKPPKYETLGKSYFYSPKTIFDNFADAKDLGIVFTDRGTTNYTTDGKNNISIDSGHAEYMDILKPGLTGYHITLPSNTGFSQLAYYGVLNKLN